MRLVVVAVAVAALLARAGAARADERDEFYRAMNLDREGKPAEAAAVLSALVERAPDDPFADDALLELGAIYEEKLRDPVRAAETYERLLTRFPDSRHALRARRHAERLRAALGPGNQAAAPLAELNDILYGFAQRPRAESIARMERLVRDHPDFPEAPRAVFWLGSAYQQDGRAGDALARYRDVLARWPDGDWAVRAQKATGDVLLARGDFDGAQAAYRALRGRGDPTLELTADEALRRLAIERWRARATWASWALVALFAAGMIVVARHAAGSWRSAGRALARPPVEFWYLVPVALLFAFAAMTEHQGLGRAVEVILAGALVVTWLSGAALEAVRARRGRVSLVRAVGQAAWSGTTILAICWIAVTRERLLDMLMETVRFGAER
jgi:tetratricopeptide (TPR) repeat protein